MGFLPSALNVKVMKLNQARVNGGSKYDSLKVAKYLPLAAWQELWKMASREIIVERSTEY